jgi:hypothetical protein
MENGDADLKFSWQLQVQLLKMTMVTGLSLMGDGNAYNHPAT